MADVSIINVSNWLPPLVVDKEVLEKPAIDVKINFTRPPALEKLAKDVKEKWIKEWTAAFNGKFDAEFWKMSNDVFSAIQKAVDDIQKRFKAKKNDADYDKLVEGANASLKNAVATWQGMTVKKCEEIGKKAAEVACKITKQVLGLIWQGTKWAVSLVLRAGIRLAQGALKVLAAPIDLVTAGAASAAINAAAGAAARKISQYVGASFPTLSNTLGEAAAEVRALIKDADPRVGKMDELAKTLQLHLEMQSKQFVSLSMSLDEVIKADPKGEACKQAQKTKGEMAKLEGSNKKNSDTLNAIRKFQGSYNSWKAGDAKGVIDSATATRAAFDAASGALVSALGNFVAKAV
jgi:hypothetical protein